MQQLDALTSDELLQVRAKVDALIQAKTSTVPNVFFLATLPIATSYPFATLIPSSRPSSRTIHGIRQLNKLDEHNITYSSKLQADRDTSLKEVIDLVDEWMNDESGYDKEAYPQIEAALKQNHPS